MSLIADELKDLDCEPTFFITTSERIDDIDFATSSLSAGTVKVTVGGSPRVEHKGHYLAS